MFSKGLESILHDRLVSFSEKYNVLTASQYGFRKNRSTELALLDQKEFILDNFEKKNIVLGVYVDFTKAFDYLNHKLLFQKLETYGIRGQALTLLKSYLCHGSSTSTLTVICQM